MLNTIGRDNLPTLRPLAFSQARACSPHLVFTSPSFVDCDMISLSHKSLDSVTVNVFVLPELTGVRTCGRRLKELTRAINIRKHTLSSVLPWC